MWAWITVNRLAVGLVASCSVFPLAASTLERAAWAIDPAITGPTLPPVGRSLFDFATAEGVPFPFEALVRQVADRAGCPPAECMQSVLIPLGRSLQRTAAAPDFLLSPRVVVAITGEGAGPMFAKDRIFIGYQEKANIVEVISYNDKAGRFEFQQVRDYRAGGARQVIYADRNVCIACHQNHAPIFSRPAWAETNANPKIAARLGAARAHFYGVPVHRGVDIPNAIDDSTDRANRAGATQRIWREACDAGCRGMALTAALQYRLSGERGFDKNTTLAGALARGFAARWPSGLAIPNPDLPNRDPLAFAPSATGVAQSHVPASLEPLAPRGPAEIWTADDPTLVRRFVMGLADLIAESDVREIDAALARRAANAPRRTFVAGCTLSGERYACAGEIALQGSATRVDTLAFGGTPMANFTLKDGLLTSHGRSARTAAGDRIERVVLHRTRKQVTVTVVDDFAIARAAIANIDWPDAPFSRVRMREVLGLDSRAVCCEDATGLHAPKQDVTSSSPLSPIAAEFQSHCAACHRTSERFPPNFLAGDAQRVSASLVQCAPRIFVRLAMWQTPANLRAKVPMPPPLASRDGSPWTQSAPDPVIAVLQAKAADWLRAESGRNPEAAEMLAGGYENLRPCLPADL